MKKLYNMEFIRFGLVGGTGYIFNFALLFFFTDIAGLYYMISAVIAFVVNSVWNYLLNSKLTFRMNGGMKGYLRYLMATMITRGIYFALLFILTDLTGLHYLVSSTLAVGFCFLINYGLSRKYVWKKAVVNAST